jgi:hypothetical protein
MDTAEFEAILVTKMAALQTALPESERKRLSVLAGTNGAMADTARSLLDLTVAANGLSTDLSENKAVYEETGQKFVETTLLALSSTIEETGNSIKSAALTTAMTAFDALFSKLGGSFDDIGTGLLGVLNEITDSFDGKGLAGGARDLFKKLDTTTQALITAAAAITASNELMKKFGGSEGGLLGLGAGAAIATMGANVKNALATTSRVALKWATPVAILASAIEGAQSKELKDSGMNVAERIDTQVISNTLSLVDMMANAGGNLIDMVSGRDDFGNLDLGNKYKEHALLVEKWEQSLIPVSPKFPARPTLPVDTTPKNIPQSGATVGQTGEILTGINKDNAWRHGERGKKFLQEQSLLSKTVAPVTAKPVAPVTATTVDEPVTAATENPVEPVTVNVEPATVKVEPVTVNVEPATIVEPKQDKLPLPVAKTGQTGEILTGMNKDNAWRHGERGEKFLQEQIKATIETNRLMRKLLTAIENN